MALLTPTIKSYSIPKGTDLFSFMDSHILFNKRDFVINLILNESQNITSTEPLVIDGNGNSLSVVIPFDFFSNPISITWRNFSSLTFSFTNSSGIQTLGSHFSFVNCNTTISSVSPNFRITKALTCDHQSTITLKGSFELLNEFTNNGTVTLDGAFGEILTLSNKGSINISHGSTFSTPPSFSASLGSVFDFRAIPVESNLNTYELKGQGGSGQPDTVRLGVFHDNNRDAFIAYKDYLFSLGWQPGIDKQYPTAEAVIGNDTYILGLRYYSQGEADLDLNFFAISDQYFYYGWFSEHLTYSNESLTLYSDSYVTQSGLPTPVDTINNSLFYSTLNLTTSTSFTRANISNPYNKSLSRGDLIYSTTANSLSYINNISGTTIYTTFISLLDKPLKTINGQSILGSGDLTVQDARLPDLDSKVDQWIAFVQDLDRDKQDKLSVVGSYLSIDQSAATISIDLASFRLDLEGYVDNITDQLFDGKVDRSGDTITGDLVVEGIIDGHVRGHLIRGTQSTSTSTWLGEAPWLSSLYDGLEIDYFLPVAGSGNASLTLTLKDGSTTPAIPVYWRGGVGASNGTPMTTHLGAGNWGTFKYLATGFGTKITTPVWMFQYSYNSDTTDRLYYSNTIKAAESIFAYKWIMKDIDGNWRPLFPTSKTTSQVGTVISPFLVSSYEFRIDSPILHYNGSTEVKTTGSTNNLYRSIPYDFRYNINVTSLTANKDLYLKGTIGSRGGFIINQSSYYTQDLPTTFDGFYYLYIGFTYSTTQVRLDVNHPIYFVNEDGKLCVYSGGLQGPTGNGIDSIGELSSGTGYTDYRIYFTNGTHYDFTVENGSDGQPGSPGPAGRGISQIVEDGDGPGYTSYRIDFTDGSPSFSFNVANGEKGEPGQAGRDGDSVEFVSYEDKGSYTEVSLGNQNTEEIGKFQVPNGQPGLKGVGFYYTSASLTSSSNMVAGSSITPNGVNVNDFIVSSTGDVFQITSIIIDTPRRYGISFKTSIKGADGQSGSGGSSLTPKITQASTSGLLVLDPNKHYYLTAQDGEFVIQLNTDGEVSGSDNEYMLDVYFEEDSLLGVAFDISAMFVATNAPLDIRFAPIPGLYFVAGTRLSLSIIGDTITLYKWEYLQI